MLNKNDENAEEKYIENDEQGKEDTINAQLFADSGNDSSNEDQKSGDSEIEPLKQLEASSKGKIKGSLLVNYFKYAQKPFTLAFLVFSFLFAQILASVSDIWVSYW